MPFLTPESSFYLSNMCVHLFKGSTDLFARGCQSINLIGQSINLVFKVDHHLCNASSLSSLYRQPSRPLIIEERSEEEVDGEPR